MNTEYSSCVYRSKDPIRNFKIKVTLFKSTGGRTNYNKNDLKKEKGLDNLYKNLNDVAKSEAEEVIISWQTKIFSKTEYTKYSNPDFVTDNPLEKQYKEECLKLKERNYQPGRIFTYIDSDPYQFHDEIENEISKLPDSALPPYLEKPKSNVRKRRPLVGHAKSIEANIPHKNIVNYSPNNESADKKNVISRIIPFHTMYIMADLSNNKSVLNRERVLCCIKIDSNGMIIMKPDFSHTSYLIYTYGISRETYEYYLEHISNRISTDNLTRELKLHKELYARHADYIRSLVGNIFKLPEPSLMKVHVFGEIISAKNFDYDDLNVYYQLELPKNWHPYDPSMPISGFTQTSRTKIEKTNEVAYFSHPFEFDLYYKNDEINMNDRDPLPKMPKILFEVASYDSWTRYRTEGYTWTQLPSKSGTLQEELPCWRPRGDSIIYEMRRFFIGGSPELEDISYVCTPSDHEGSILSRLGFRATTTGSIKIRLNTAFQSQVFLNSKTSKKLNNKSQLLDKMGNYSNLNDLIGVLEQFNLARKRMIEARDDSKKLLLDEE